ncbi:unnamed protein product [Fraxinus pennsylvanica]|uniref:Reverse transcriptase domain-containing protein n=1 Tax=Fraxinus pennsylvanica TaxID=56036 RepID=A0AAD2E732_9LAMI|nr:unnamed protein product [Fraxinus pennsylvanica]
MKFSTESDRCFQIHVLENVDQDTFLLYNSSDAYEACIAHSQSTHSYSFEIETSAKFLETNPPYTWKRQFEKLVTGPTRPLPSVQQPPKLELKQLPPHLRYVYLGDSSTLLVIISSLVSEVEKERVLQILMEEKFKPCIDGQRRLNRNMKEVVRAEVLKLIDVGTIYPISGNAWISQVQVVPKKGGITVVQNEKN